MRGISWARRRPETATYLHRGGGAMLQPALPPLANVTFYTSSVGTLGFCQLCLGGRTILRVWEGRSESQQVVDLGKEALRNLNQLSASCGCEGGKKHLPYRKACSCVCILSTSESPSSRSGAPASR
jgi:hypothetical protein